LILEGITFKLALDFFLFLKKNRVTTTSIRVDFFDKVKHQYLDFVDVAAMQVYYNSNYILPNDDLRDLVSISSFIAASDLYDFVTEFRALNVTTNLNLEYGSAYDRQRNAGRTVLIDRQIQLIKNAVTTYVNSYTKLV
jgi:hypothetical protein